MIGKKRALLLQEMEEIGHLLEIRRHVRIVAAKVDIVELEINDMLDAVTLCCELACRAGGGISRRRLCSQERCQRPREAIIPTALSFDLCPFSRSN